MSRTSELHAYFMSKVLPLLGQKSKPMVWQEVFDEGVALPSDAIIQVWKRIGAEDMVRILSKGHKVIYSASWYLDRLSNGGDWNHLYIYDPRLLIPHYKGLKLEDVVGGEAFEHFSQVLQAKHKVIYSASWYLDYLHNGGDWDKFYTVDPRQMIPRHYKDLDLNNILGGEACMWGEAVDDRNLISRVWPRSSAVAEKLWSSESPRFSFFRNIAIEVNRRLEEHACRMNRRGVHAQPPTGPGFCVGAI
ncbi:hypothetical protein HF086_015975 [Spodoptera exigua]|uniref:beta-N-acetylhexosaminidase n=1 Tax=Spodoptera exigua TaxID=7107 RepID=A0A922SCQ3_SPOEX|nr:hypothetical protein HF086_015975 [Spodoptera exigua]